jgi:hypothetical protein
LRLSLLGDALKFDWQELRRLAGQPEYRILEECKALVREVANEPKTQSSLDSNE